MSSGPMPACSYAAFAAMRVAAEKSGMESWRSSNGLLLICDARTRTARFIRPSSRAFFSLHSTAAAEPSTFTEHISFVFG